MSDGRTFLELITNVTDFRKSVMDKHGFSLSEAKEAERKLLEYLAEKSKQGHHIATIKYNDDGSLDIEILDL